MILLSASKVWLLVQRDGSISSFLTLDQKSFIASPASANESWEGGRCQENLRDLLLELDVPVSRWMFSGPDLLQEIWFVHLRLRKINFPFSLGRIHPLLHWVFLHRFPMRPSFPTPQCLQPVCHPSKLHPRTKRIRGTIQVRLSFQIDGFLTGLTQRKGSTQPVNQTEWLVF